MSVKKTSRGYPDNQRIIFVCEGTGCVSAKAVEIRQALEKAVEELKLDSVKRPG
jgi:hypothetical protein